MLSQSSLLQAEHARDEFTFQLQHSPGSTEGLPSLVTTALLFSPFFPSSVLPRCQVKAALPSPRCVLCFACRSHTYLGVPPSRQALEPRRDASCLLLLLLWLLGKRRSGAPPHRSFQVILKDSPKRLCHRQTGPESSLKLKRRPPASALPGPPAATAAQQINVTVAPHERPEPET